jgi:hypothetical protein
MLQHNVHTQVEMLQHNVHTQASTQRLQKNNKIRLHETQKGRQEEQTEIRT